MLLDTSCFKNLLLTKGKVHIGKRCIFFEISIHLIFAPCFLPSAARSLKRTKKHRGIEIRFLGLLGPFLRLRGLEISVRDMRHKIAGFYHVLSVSVVPSVFVECATESNDVFMTCFLRCVFRAAHIEVP